MQSAAIYRSARCAAGVLMKPVLLAICLYVVTMCLWAHSRDTISVRGRVSANGRPVPNSAVLLLFLRPTVPGAYGRTVVSRTDANGDYRVASLPKGAYVVQVWKHGIKLYEGRFRFDQPENVQDVVARAYPSKGRFERATMTSSVPAPRD